MLSRLPTALAQHNKMSKAEIHWIIRPFPTLSLADA